MVPRQTLSALMLQLWIREAIAETISLLARSVLEAIAKAGSASVMGEVASCQAWSPGP